MLRWLPAIDYPAKKPGYWEPVTSTINWCEEDYYATRYSAEVVNAFTNLLFFWLGARGIRNCLKHGHDLIYTVSFVGYIMVGIGSFWFHNTLKYPMQLVDELSMIYTTCIMCHACFSYGMSREFSWLLACGLVVLSAFITIYYHYLQDPTFHEIVYAVLTAIIFFRSVYVMEMSIRPSLRNKYGKAATLQAQNGASMSPKESEKNSKRDEQILRDMWWMIAIGLSVFLGGFGLWTIDNKYCSQLRRWRRAIGLPWGILLEGHGWWHLMTGVGAYFYLVWGIWLRHCLNGEQADYTLRWPSVLSLPDIVKNPGCYGQDRLRKQATVNGHVKKAD